MSHYANTTRGPATHARLCDSSMTSGGSRTILHDTVRDAIHGFANESGCVSFLEPVGIHYEIEFSKNVLFLTNPVNITSQLTHEMTV